MDKTQTALVTGRALFFIDYGHREPWARPKELPRGRKPDDAATDNNDAGRCYFKRKIHCFPNGDSYIPSRLILFRFRDDFLMRMPYFSS